MAVNKPPLPCNTSSINHELAHHFLFIIKTHLSLRDEETLAVNILFSRMIRSQAWVIYKNKKYSGFSCLVLGFVFDKYFCLGSEDSNTLESRKISINRLSWPDDLQTENTNKSAVGRPVVEISCCSSWYLNDTQCSGVIRSKVHKEKNPMTSCTCAARKQESAVLVFTQLGCCDMAISWSFVTFYLI